MSRHWFKASASLFAVALSAVAVACSDAPLPSAPAAAPGEANATLLSAAEEVQVLKRTQQITHDIVRSYTVDPKSGLNFEVKEAGLKVSFPKGAVDRQTTITLTVRAGDLVSYDFQPHGLQFGAPVAIEQDLTYTTAYGDKSLQSKLEGAYYPDASMLDTAKGTAWVTEIYPIDFTSISKSKIKYDIYHFSGYVVASGRTL